MKHKLIFVGALIGLAVAIVFLVLGRNGWNQNNRSDYNQAVLTSDGQLSFQPGNRKTMTVVVAQRKTGRTNSPPAPSSAR